jgi:hypothetical protein
VSKLAAIVGFIGKARAATACQDVCVSKVVALAKWVRRVASDGTTLGTGQTFICFIFVFDLVEYNNRAIGLPLAV